MAWAISSRLRSIIRTKAATGVLVAIAAAVGVPVHAAPNCDYALSAPAVLPAPPPSDAPPAPPPPPPAPAQPSHGEYYNPNDQDDWWVYSGTGSF
jgi:hypothetical protein